jgi:hypothetical protein
MTEPSSQKLVQALAELNDAALVPIMNKAQQDYYHDFKSPLAMPEHQLVHDLRILGHESLAQRVINGEFDATKEEADAWAKSPEGQQAFRDLMGGK